MRIKGNETAPKPFQQDTTVAIRAPPHYGISGVSQTWLNDVAALMNNRPRKTLGWKTPAEAMAADIMAFKSTLHLKYPS